MDSKHTKAPWKIEPVKSGDKNTLVYLRIKGETSVGFVSFAGVYKQKDESEARANAELIANAPAMLLEITALRDASEKLGLAVYGLFNDMEKDHSIDIGKRESELRVAYDALADVLKGATK